MTEAPEMRWCRLWTDIIEDPKLLLLAPDDRWYYVAILAIKRSGVLDEPDSPETRDRKVALRLRLDHRERDELRRRLVEVRLIDENWQPCGWEKRQFSSDSSTHRVRAFRERSRNVSETGQRQIQSQIQRQKREEGAIGAPDGLDRKAFGRFAEYRDSIGKPLAPASILAAQRKLAGFGEKQADVVEQTIANGWTGLFHVKPNRDEPKKSTWRAPPEDPDVRT